MNLRAVEPEPVPPLPALPPARLLCRPGERHEAIRLEPHQARRLEARAADAGVSADLAVALLVEHRLTVDWLGSQGLHVPHHAGAPPAVPVALSAAEAGYLRAITVGRRPRRRAARVKDPPTTFAVPVRLVARCSPAVIARAVDGDLEQAVAREAEALRVGIGLGELLTRCALSAARGGRNSAGV